MSGWRYSQSNESRGPVPLAELQRMLDSGTLPPSTSVWTEGMTDWQPASAVAALQISPYAAPAEDLSPGVDLSGYTPDGPQIRPWVRYWARTFDMLLFSIASGFVLEMFAPAVLELPEFLLGMLFVVAYSFVEPLLMSAFGTTPFKALFNVRVRNQDGSRPGYVMALRRSMSVFVFGEGVGLPLLSLITNIASYQTLTRTGITRWDANLGFTVSHRRVAWWRWLVVVSVPVALVIGFIYLITLGLQES